MMKASEASEFWWRLHNTLVTLKHTVHVKRRFVPQGYKSPLAKPKRRTYHAGTIFPSAPYGNRSRRRLDVKPASNPQCTKRRAA